MSEYSKPAVQAVCINADCPVNMKCLRFMATHQQGMLSVRWAHGDDGCMEFLEIAANKND